MELSEGSPALRHLVFGMIQSLSTKKATLPLRENSFLGLSYGEGFTNSILYLNRHRQNLHYLRHS